MRLVDLLASAGILAVPSVSFSAWVFVDGLEDILGAIHISGS